MSAFFRRAEDILRIASSDSSDLGDALMVLDRQGGFRMLEPAGWSLPAVAAEFGGEAVYKVERRGHVVRVEGWDGRQRCLLQSQTGLDGARGLFGAAFVPQAGMPKLTAPAIG